MNHRNTRVKHRWTFITWRRNSSTMSQYFEVCLPNPTVFFRDCNNNRSRPALVQTSWKYHRHIAALSAVACRNWKVKIAICTMTTSRFFIRSNACGICAKYFSSILRRLVPRCRIWTIGSDFIFQRSNNARENCCCSTVSTLPKSRTKNICALWNCWWCKAIWM